MSEKKRCPDFDKYLLILRQVLDNDSTKEEEQRLYEHLDKCSCCLQEYELEKQVKFLLKKKIQNQPTPAGLASTIKARILQSVINER